MSEEKLYAGKYKTVEDMEAGYKALESKLGAPKPDPLLEGRVTPPGGEQGEPDAVRGLKAQLAQKLNALGYALQAGKPEAAGMLAELGMDQGLAQFTTMGFQDGYRQYEKSIHSISGGPEGHKELVQFGLESEHLSPIERYAFRSAQNSGDPNIVVASLQAMKDRHRQITGFEPHELQVAVPGGQSIKVKPFASSEEAGRATADPRYGKDEAYRAEVQARMRVSTYETASSGTL